MKYINRKSIFIILLLMIFHSCSTIPPLDRKSSENFTTNGFLDKNHFQVVVKSTPDYRSKGLVQARNSSMTKARNSLQDRVIARLSDYYIQGNNLNLNSEKKKILQNKVYPLLSYGKPLAEFYDKKNNAYIIYRIEKLDLKAYLLNIKL